jgi:hypothetical protein
MLPYMLVDGNTGSNAHSIPSASVPAPARFRLDLVNRHVITQVALYPRNGYAARTSNIIVYVGDDGVTPANNFMCCAANVPTITTTTWRNCPCPFAAGRYIWLLSTYDSMDTAEVQVTAVKPDTVVPAFEVSLSSLQASFPASIVCASYVGSPSDSNNWCV